MSKRTKIMGLLNRPTVQDNQENQAKQELLETMATIQESVNTEVQKDVSTVIQEPVNTAVKKKATFELDEALHMQLKVFAATNGKRMVEVVEEALKKYFQES